MDNGDQTFLNGVLLGQNNRLASTNNASGFADLASQLPCSEFREYEVSADDPRLRWDQENVLAVRVFNGGTGGGLVSSPLSLRMNGLPEYLALEVHSEMLDSKPDGKMNRTVFLKNRSPLPEIAGRLVVQIQDQSDNHTIHQQSHEVVLKQEAVRFKIDYPLVEAG